MFFVCVLLNIFIFYNNLGLTSSDNLHIKEWKCANRECNVPISEGETVLPYSRPDHVLKLTFKAKELVQVLKKPGDNEKEQDYWWISLDGKEGYVNKQFIQERKIKTKTLVPVRESDNHPSIPISPTPSYIVSEGTTIFTNYNEENSQTNDNNYGGDNSTDDYSDVDDNLQVDDEDVEVVEDEELEMEMPDNVPLDLTAATSAKPHNGIPPKPVVATSTAKPDITTSSAKPDIAASTGKPDITTSAIPNIAEVLKPDILTRTIIPPTSKLDTIASAHPLKTTSEINIIKETPSETEKDLTNPAEKVEDQTFKSEELGNNNSFIPSTDEVKAPYQSILTSTSTDGVVEQKSELNNGNNVPPVSENESSLPSNLPDTPPVVTDSPPLKQETVTMKDPVAHDDKSLKTPTNLNSDPALNLPNNENKIESIPPDINSSVNTNIESAPSDLNNSFDKNISPPLIMQGQNTESFPHKVSDDVVNKQAEISESSPYSTEKPELKEIEPNNDLNDNNIKSSESVFDNTLYDTTERAALTKEDNDLGVMNNVIPIPESNNIKPVENLVVNNLEVSNENQKEEWLDVVTTENTELPTFESTLHSDFKNNEAMSDTTSGDISNYGYQQEATTEINNLSFTESVAQSQEQNESLDVKSSIENKVDSEINQEQPVDITTERPSEENVLDEPYNLNGNMEMELNNYETSSQKWYSSLYTFMDSLKVLYITSFGESNTSEPDNSKNEINEPLISQSDCRHDQSGDLQDGHCELQKSTEKVDILLSPQNGDVPATEYEPEDTKGGENNWSYKSILWLVMSSLVVLCFSLGYYYLENVRRDGELVRKNNVLASELFVVEREKAILEEEFVALKAEVQKLLDERSTIENLLSEVKEELQKTKEEKIIIEERETKLTEKLTMVEKNYNEMRRIFSECKQKGERATLTAHIKKLKETITAGNAEITALKEELQEKKNEVKLLNQSLQKSQEAKISLEERLDKMVIESQGIAKEYQVTLAKMEQTIEENKIVQSKLENDLRKQIKECESLTIQKELAESALQKAHGITSSESLAEWLEIKKVRTTLMAAEKEVDKLNQEKEKLVESLETAQEKGKSLTREVSELNEKYENAEKEKIEALTKLQVLSNYFKEKESQLQEELGTKEAQWFQKQSDDSTIYQQMRDLREENISLKGLVETLKKEILDQESAYKKIINTTEQKAHENWVSYRRAEVRLKEAQAEAAQLRNRLTTLETCDDVTEDKINKTAAGLEVNGDLPPLGSAMSPPFMLYPNEFIPPPPLLPSPAGGNPTSRPPPLGRISSPPLVSGDFIPPPPLIPAPFDVFSHVHPSPPSPPPPLLHKPQPRDHQHQQQHHQHQQQHHHHPHHPHHNIAQSSQVPPLPPRKQKDSQSSNHSSESLQEKTPARRSKR